MKNGSPVSGGISLDDKYLLEGGRAFMTGIQALVRLPLDRKRLDRKLGLNTAGFISGYRGSPLGGYDQQINAAGKLMAAHDVKLWEGLNEDLGATAVWGSQQTHLFQGAGCRSHGRCVQACQHGGDRPQGRRAGVAGG